MITNKEAIEIIRNMNSTHRVQGNVNALDIAIKALEQMDRVEKFFKAIEEPKKEKVKKWKWKHTSDKGIKMETEYLSENIGYQFGHDTGWKKDESSVIEVEK